VNARDVLPPDLLNEVQNYISGDLIYIPKQADNKAAWGQISGIREEVRHRNQYIFEQYKSGVTVDELMAEHCLSEASIKKIVYRSRNALC
jgi:Mor family transcriptional regulator